jgi:cysteine desulfurase / selenocysteine lyase
MSASESTVLLDETERASEFPVVAEYTYLNAATQGPLPSRACRAIERAALQAQYGALARPQEQAPGEVARGQLARLLGVGEDDFVFTANTTHGLNICARGIEWRPGDNVVLPAREFPSVLRTWLQLRELGVEVRLVHTQGVGPTVEELMDAVDARTRAVSCSAVAWDSGSFVDLEALGRRCERAGCLLIVDGIQAVGAVELDLRALRVSALTFHGYKWLLAGFGCGALYVTPEALDRIQPRFVGEQAFVIGADPADDAPWQPGARRYSAGGANVLGLTALTASLGLIEQVGLARIAAHNRRLAQLLVDGLLRLAPAVQLVSPADPERRAAIVVFTLGEPKRDEALVARLAERGIVVVCRRRGVRVSPHLYNTEDEIERLLAALPACW